MPQSNTGVNTYLQGPCLFGYCVRVQTNMESEINQSIAISLVPLFLFALIVLLAPQFNGLSLPVFAVIGVLQMRMLKIHKLVSFDRAVPGSNVANGKTGLLYWLLKLGQWITVILVIWVVINLYSKP